MIPGEYEFADDRLGSPLIHSKQHWREAPESLMVFMPAALPPDRPDRKKQIYSRYWWRNLWPAADAIAFADPALQLADELNGAWFIYPEHDLIGELANLAGEHADRRGIPVDRVVFYGSSLGGGRSFVCGRMSSRVEGHRGSSADRFRRLGTARRRPSRATHNGLRNRRIPRKVSAAVERYFSIRVGGVYSAISIDHELP